MLSLHKMAAVFVLSTMAPLALAAHFTESYLGAEAIQTNQNYKLHHGRRVFKENTRDVSIFAGFKFSHYFGAELGYELQPKKRKTVSAGFSTAIPAGEDTFNDQSYAASITSTNSIQGHHPYVGIFGEYKLQSAHLERMRFQAMVGASVSKVKIRQDILSTTGTLPADYIVGNTLTGTRTKVVPMIKLSAVHDFTKRFAVRLSVNYQNLRLIRVKIDQDLTHSQSIRLRDTFGIGLGVVYLFN